MSGPTVGSRSGFLLAAAWAMAAAGASLAFQPEALKVGRQGDRLLLSAPQFHFLEGKPLERLHDGATVTYLLAVTVREEAGGAEWFHHEERFVFSYDLWEEKFSVVQAKAPRRSVSRLDAGAAEAWCLEQLPVRVPATAEKPFVVKLACSVPEDDQRPGEGLTLSTLIDVFSRKRAAAPPRWEVRSGPLRLADLQETTRR